MAVSHVLNVWHGGGFERMMVVSIMVDAGRSVVLSFEPENKRGARTSTGTVDCCYEHEY